MHILHVPSDFLTSKTGEENGLWLGRITPESSSSWTIFSIPPSNRTGIGKVELRLVWPPPVVEWNDLELYGGVIL
jgi:hypothetical protein